MQKPITKVTLLMALTISVVTLLVYLPARHNDFLNWDDQSYVTDNDHVRGGITKDGIIWAFTQSHSGNWHPVTWISHALDCQIYGLQPGGHHFTSLLLHSINAALLFCLLYTITGKHWRSAFVAGIFSLHPLRVESVAWVSERKDVISLFFGLIALISYVRYAQCERRDMEQGTEATHHSQDKMRRIWYAITLIMLGLGLLSKPMLVTWPLVMLLLDVWPLKRIDLTHDGFRDEAGRKIRRLILEKIPLFALVIISCAVTLWAQQRGGSVASFEQLPFSFRLQNAAVAYIQYLAKFFWPTQLSPIYPYPEYLTGWQVAVSLVFLLIVTMVVWHFRYRFPYALIGWLWFLGTLVPVIGIVQVGSQAFADRYTYIPEIGLALIVVWLLAEGARKLHLSAGISITLTLAIATALACLTRQQLPVWKNTETLFRRTLELSPNNPQALNGLGAYWIKIGRTTEGKRLLEQLVKIEPSFVEARGAIADALDNEGHYAEAATNYALALAIQPENPSLLNNLAWLRATCPDATIRNGSNAVELAARACELTSYTKPLFIGTLAAAYAESKNFENAISTAKRAADLATSLQLKEIAARNWELIQLYNQGKTAYGGNPKE